MTSRDGRQSTHAELPVEVLQAMKSDDRDNWKIITEGVKLVLGIEAETLPALERLEERLNREIQSKRDQRQNLQNDLQGLIDRCDEIREKIDEIRSNRRAYDEILDEVIGTLECDRSLGIDSQLSDIIEAAKIRFDCHSPSEGQLEQVRDEIRNRIAERDVQVDSYQLYSDLTRDQYADRDEARDGLRSLGGE